MDFRPNQQVAFLCNDTTPATWQVAKFVKLRDTGVCEVEYHGRSLVVLKQDILRFESCSDERVENFGKDNLPSLVHHLNEAIKHFNLTQFTNEVKVEDNGVSLMRGGMTVQPGTMQVRGIGVVREIPCWTVSGWHTAYSCNRDIPPDVDEVPLGSSANTIATVQMVIEEAIKDSLRCYFEQPDIDAEDL
jgi:hypothetical protein